MNNIQKEEEREVSKLPKIYGDSILSRGTLKVFESAPESFPSLVVNVFSSLTH